MSDKQKDLCSSEKWLHDYYLRITALYNVSRQSLHNTHQWAITLTLAVITAIFTLDKEAGYPNENGLLILLIGSPLLVRFFIRSCLEYAIQLKFQIIRDELDRLFLSSEKTVSSFVRLKKVIETYYFEFRSPQELRIIMKNNLKLAYSWILIVWIGLILWGFISLGIDCKSFFILIIVLVFIVYEFVSIFKYPKLKYVNKESLN